MKKSLVALAVMAATTASFAQVTVTGALGFSVQKSSAVATDRTSQGMQMTDGHITVSATENLGGGYSATASSEVLLRGRDTAVTARDASISLATPAGVITAASIEVGPLIANAWAGAPASFTDGPDGIVMDGYNNIDLVSYSAPMGAFKLGAAFLEVNSGDNGLPASTFGATTSPYSATTGTGGNRTGVSGYQISASYAAGAFAVDADYTMFMAAKGVSELNDGHNRARVAGTFDAGAFKVGLGFQTKNKGVAAQYAAGISAPIGKMTLGLTYSARNKQDVVLGDTGATLVAAADSRSGTTLGLQYDLSKTTNVSAQYAVYSGVGSVAGSVATNDNEYRIRLMKSF